MGPIWRAGGNVLTNLTHSVLRRLHPEAQLIILTSIRQGPIPKEDRYGLSIRSYDVNVNALDFGHSLPHACPDNLGGDAISCGGSLPMYASDQEDLIYPLPF